LFRFFEVFCYLHPIPDFQVFGDALFSEEVVEGENGVSVPFVIAETATSEAVTAFHAFPTIIPAVVLGRALAPIPLPSCRFVDLHQAVILIFGGAVDGGVFEFAELHGGWGRK